MDWNAIGDVLLALLQAVILATVPVITKFVTDFFSAKTVELQTKTVNANLSNIVGMVGDLAKQSVAYVSQTYVDSLKRDGQFNVEEQQIAAKLAFERLVRMVDEDSKEILTSVFGNLAIYFETLIEAAVREANVFGQITAPIEPAVTEEVQV